MFELLNKLTENQERCKTGCFMDELRLKQDEGFFSNADIYLSRAPGRMDLMGGIADYSGSLVLQMSISEAAFAAAQLRSDQKIQIMSACEDEDRSINAGFELKTFISDGKIKDYAELKSIFAEDSSTNWSAYIAGCIFVLAQEENFQLDAGINIYLNSTVPEGKGVSSSAAIEVATMAALTALFDIELSARDLAIYCQKVENLIVGAPCGIMDQMSSAACKENELIELLCQPAELQGSIKIPDDLEVWGLDSGIKHSVGGADYGSVRIGAFMGFRIIADCLDIDFQQGAYEENKFESYLANMSPSEFDAVIEQIPFEMSGAEFCERYTGFHDTVTQIDPAVTYRIRVPAKHPVFEHQRVRHFAELLQTKQSVRRNELLGELMYQSHRSYSDCGLGTDGTDLIVQLARETGAGIYGAKITGGGSGGSVAILCDKGSAQLIEKIALDYKNSTGIDPYIFQGTSPGAIAFGTIRLCNVDS